MTTYLRAAAVLVLLPLLGGAVPVAVPPVPAPGAVSLATLPGKSGFRWPLDGVPRPVRRFDPPPQPWLPGHRGVDLAAGPGAVVRAAGPGVVLFAGQVAGRPVVSVSHPAGLRTTYEPVAPGVAAGDPVAPGDPLGVLLPGHPGCPVEACLHWGLRRGDEYLDPLALLGLGRVRLLPFERRGRRARVGGRRPVHGEPPGVDGRAYRAGRGCGAGRHSVGDRVGVLRTGRRAGRVAAGRAGRTPRRGCTPAR